ncbi:MAG TPA: cytochrome C [Burkholderiales bacterium]|nr:cytochrome C [Burkholderiales bacterium]
MSAWHQQALAADAAKNAKAAEPEVHRLSNDACLTCHGQQGFAVQGADGKARALHVATDKFGKSVHGKRECVDCHTGITELPHKAGATLKVSCVSCHDAVWRTAKLENKTQEHVRLGVVVQQIDHYMKSIHARLRRDDPSRSNAICYDCHSPHYIYPKGSPERAEWRLSVPDVCGKCHAKEREQYATSVHGKAVLGDKNPAAAICSDCHSTHDIADPSKDTAKLAITKNCGGCHAENLKTYTKTYHGQVNTLGYAYTAKCYDCHGSHGIQKLNDPRANMHPDNRLKTCQKCHEGATQGYATFEPHGTSHDLARYPHIWVASKFMLLLVGATILFFWSHSALWLYREYRERKERKPRSYVKTDELLDARFKGKHYQRFPLGWRIAHLTLAVSVMMLTLTGMSVLYADTTWAPAVMQWLGGPKVAAVVHRTFAVLLLSLFVGHMVYLVVRLGRNWGSLDWFGPNSLAPRWQDLADIVAMVKWFLGLGPRPVFDRWTYWEKFDYWAPFAALILIGATGLMLWFSKVTAAFLPGWAFNVATIFHGEEALLTALFLFTVHFFNNHFRPDKFPLDVVMFTGSMRLERFKSEHRVEYNRLVASGELEKYLVDAPSEPMTRGSKILGFTLIAFGLLLLAFVLIGIFSTNGA